MVAPPVAAATAVAAPEVVIATGAAPVAPAATASAAGIQPAVGVGASVPTPAATAGANAPAPELPGTQASYVECGYWGTGYAEDDCADVVAPEQVAPPVASTTAQGTPPLASTGATLTPPVVTGSATAPQVEVAVAQVLAPSSTVSQTSWTGGHAEIDEAVPSNSDFCYGGNNVSSATLTVALPTAAVPIAGDVVVRWRYARVNSGTVVNTGSSPPSQTCSLMEGATALGSLTVTPDGTWRQASFTVATSAVGDWSALRLRWTQSGSGTGGNARGTAVSWARAEVPPVA